MTKRRKQTRKRPTKRRRMEENSSSSFDPDLILSIFKNVWAKKDLERQKSDNVDTMDCDVVLLETSTSKKNKISSVNCNALKLSCELVRVFISEAVQRAAMIAEAEGGSKIEATHLERILPQLLLDF